MSGVLKSDLLEEMEAEELEGNVASAVRRFYVTADSYNDSRVLLEAFTISGVPLAGSYFPGNTNLVCTGRKVRLLNRSKHNCEIRCEYMRLGESRSSFIFSLSTQLGQVNTQLDRYGNQNTVSHTWPGSDRDWPSQTHVQGADLAVLMPQMTLTAVGQLQVQWPDYTARLWVGSMNATFWAGADPYYWMCTRVDASPLDVGIGRNRWWEFTFEFQQAATGWVPQVFFVDPRTGKPPANLAPGLGYKNIDWYGVLDYNILFPVR